MKTPSLSRTAQAVKTSIIGELLALAARPEVISFAGGMTPLLDRDGKPVVSPIMNG